MDAEDERKRRLERERGTLARQVFDNPLWAEAYEAVAERTMQSMLSEKTDDEGTLECKRQLLALRSVKKHLERALETGRLAEAQLAEAEENERKARKQRA